jgi:hypothetical protein
MPWQDYLTSLKYFFFSASVLHFLCTSEARSFSSSMMEVFAVDVLDGDGGPASTVAIAVAAASNSSAISMVTLGTLCWASSKLKSRWIKYHTESWSYGVGFVFNIHIKFLYFHFFIVIFIRGGWAKAPGIIITKSMSAFLQVLVEE